MNRRLFPSLDQLDIQLMAELESDARQTYQNLAAKLGMNRTTVASKMKRLLDNNVIQVVCWPDPLALGYEFAVHIAIYAQPARLNSVADSLSACPQILNVWICTGRFNIHAYALFRQHEELSAFISEELGPIDGISNIETLGTLEIVKAVSRLLSDEKEPPRLESPQQDLDELDLKLIRELQNNARQRAGSLSKKLDITEPTVLRRIQRLLDERVIQIRTGIHPLALGYERSAYIGLKCDPDKVREVSDAVASYKQVSYVEICAGRYDITAFVLFRKTSDLRQFITEKLGAIPGLREIETSLTSKFVKYFDRIPL